MSIIEQATRRLEELKRAGVEVAWEPHTASTPDHHLPNNAPAAPNTTAPNTTAPNVAAPAPSAAVPLRPIEPRPIEPRPIEPRPAEPLRPPQPRPAQPSSARDRAAGAVASGALVRVGLRQSKSVELDLMKLAQAGYLVPGAPRSSLADEFRGIKQPVLRNARTQPAEAGDAPAPSHANLIMITSALAGEGKTFCALNLALSIASEVDSSVLLVDADVVRPTVMHRLGLQGRFKGLLDLLSDTSLELPDLILKTNVPKLSVLPAGAPSIHSTELLASDAMAELLDDISTRYPERIVILDAPPLLSTTESRVLATRMGQILMVVAAGSTPELDLAQAFTALEHCPTVLCVLNKSLNNPEQRHYGYYSA